jgi:hypothetical protein
MCTSSNYRPSILLNFWQNSSSKPTDWNATKRDIHWWSYSCSSFTSYCGTMITSASIDFNTYNTFTSTIYRLQLFHKWDRLEFLLLNQKLKSSVQMIRVSLYSHLQFSAAYTISFIVPWLQAIHFMNSRISPLKTSFLQFFNALSFHF